MSVKAQKSITAAGQATELFHIDGDDPRYGKRYFQALMYGGANNTVTLTRYADNKTTVICTVRIDQSSEVPAGPSGWWKASVETGDFGTGPVLVTVVQ